MTAILYFAFLVSIPGTSNYVVFSKEIFAVSTVNECFESLIRKSRF